MRTKLLAVAGLSLAALAGCQQMGYGTSDAGYQDPDAKATAKAAAPAKQNMAHVHIGHVMTSWNDTPDKMGLLPTAEAEAKIAIQHAALAMKKPDDLDWLKLHVGHVMNACDPSAVPKGPGLGYGVVRAASGVAKHVNFAAQSEGASDNVKLHAVHVATSAENTVARCREIVELGKKVMAAGSASEAAPLVARIQKLADALIAGVDANGDGNVSWEKGEGGLAAARQHMMFVMKGEGLSG
ncbi:MAG TPA: hypothetical protein ENJ38_03830 [Rhodospirillales bacterium]|nr:hypothetical protein [Rhodospirillales bacterium]